MKVILIILIALIVTIKNNSDTNQLTKEENAVFQTHECEEKTQILLKYIFNNTPLPEEYKQTNKFLFYSGSGINDIGDAESCNKLDYAKYYLVNIQAQQGKYTITLRYGLCYFRECDKQYLEGSKQHLLDFIEMKTGLKLSADLISISDPVTATAEMASKFYVGTVIVITIISILILLNIIQCCFTFTRPAKRDASIATKDDGVSKLVESEISEEKPKRERRGILISFFGYFDFIQNARKILEVRPANPQTEALKVFDGLRIMCTFWVILGHSYYVPVYYGLKNTIAVPFFIKSYWTASFIMAALYAVDAFFYLSAFMFYLSIQKYFGKSIPKVKLVFMALFNRYIRLLPMYVFVIFGVTYLIPILGSGPLYETAYKVNEPCTRYWWHNLLYINNIYDYSGGFACTGHSWYLANDMQFFILSILLFILLNNQKVIRNLIVAAVFIFSLAFQLYQAIEHKYNFLDFNHEDLSDQDFFGKFYIQPWARITPYIMGLYFCELYLESPLHKGDKDKPDDKVSFLRKINNFLISHDKVCVVLYILSMIGVYSTILTYTFVNRYGVSQIMHALFLTFHKVIFVGSLGMIIHLTLLGKFLFIRKVLSLKIFSIISKITYGVYLIHYCLMSIVYFSYPSLVYFSYVEFTFLALGFFTISVFLSFMMSLIFEGPIINLTKKLIGSRGE
jgi:peptidoglycan/LPS O-acetylase OafA/YrhL